MEFFNCIPLAKARDIIAGKLSSFTVDSETVALIDALGRIAAQDISSAEDLPPFDRSTVNGFVVRSIDTFGASEADPALFTISGEMMMGEQVQTALYPGQAVTMPTGGMLPQGSDAVVMLEYTERLDQHTLLVSKAVAPGENLVRKGEDIQSGGVIVPQGQKVEPQHIGALAACGHKIVPVRRKVEVTVISSGDELVDIDVIPGIGKVRDINSYALGAMLRAMGCIVRQMGIVKGSYEELLAMLSTAVASSSLVVISGGSRDFTVKAIEALGAPGILIHGLAVKPGKPTIFGMVGTIPVIGLPGHPVAAMTVCELLVKPAVRILAGQKQQAGIDSISARIRRNLASTPGRDDFVTVKLSKEQGEYIAEPILGKSGLISIMVQADGVVHIPANKSGIYDGEEIEVLLFSKAGLNDGTW